MDEKYFVAKIQYDLPDENTGKIKKIREVRKRRPDGVAPSATNLVDETMEYFLYNERGVAASEEEIRTDLLKAVETVKTVPTRNFVSRTAPE